MSDKFRINHNVNHNDECQKGSGIQPDSMPAPDVPDRLFMTTLLKHTGIALAIIIPLAAYTAYAKADTGNAVHAAQVDDAQSSVVSQDAPSTPTSVAQLDLRHYAGQWYEVARLPMYFQRKCASDVTATYNLVQDDAGAIESVEVVNACKQSDGSMMQSVGEALPTDNEGELKVTFLPKWLRWLPVGKADYWVLAIDDEYQSALVGSPDNEYLWMLSRMPTLSQDTFDKYKNLAIQQGYDVSKLKVTSHSGHAQTIIAQDHDIVDIDE